MATYTQRTVLTQTEVWELATPVAYVELGKVLASVEAFLANTSHPQRSWDDVCTVTADHDKITFTVDVVEE